MLSEQTELFETYDILIDSDFYADGSCKIWASGIACIQLIYINIIKDSNVYFWKNLNLFEYYARLDLKWNISFKAATFK